VTVMKNGTTYMYSDYYDIVPMPCIAIKGASNFTWLPMTILGTVELQNQFSSIEVYSDGTNLWLLANDTVLIAQVTEDDELVPISNFVAGAPMPINFDVPSMCFPYSPFRSKFVEKAFAVPAFPTAFTMYLTLLGEERIIYYDGTTGSTRIDQRGTTLIQKSSILYVISTNENTWAPVPCLYSSLPVPIFPIPQIQRAVANVTVDGKMARVWSALTGGLAAYQYWYFDANGIPLYLMEDGLVSEVSVFQAMAPQPGTFTVPNTCANVHGGKKRDIEKLIKRGNSHLDTILRNK